MDKAIPLLLWCPECGSRHIDKGEFETKLHHTHACQNCGMVWRPAILYTVGVLFLPGFKDEERIEEKIDCGCLENVCALRDYKSSGPRLINGAVCREGIDNPPSLPKDHPIPLT